MATAVALDLIKSAMRLIGVIASGETPGANESNDALGVLNDMLDAWALENLIVYRNENDTFNLVPGQQSYTIGAGGNWAVTRPVSIEQAFVTYQGVDFMMRPPLTTDEWNRIALKGQQQPVPTHIYYVGTYPLGVVNIWPVPSQALPITLSLNMQFGALASTAATIALPPGYLKLLRYSLAAELAPEFGVQASPQVLETLRDIRGNVKAANRQQPVARFDPAIAASGGGSGLPGFLGGY